MENTQNNAGFLLRTVGACIFAPIASVFTMAITGGILGIIYNLFTIMRPGIISFLSAVAATYLGMTAGRMLCDHWVKAYLHQMVFFTFAAFCVFALVMYLFFIPFSLERIPGYVQLIIIGALSYKYYWRIDPVQ